MSCWLDDDGFFQRDPKLPIYEEIECVDIEHLRFLRDRTLAMMKQGTFPKSSIRYLQMLLDDLDYLIRGGQFIYM